MWGVRGSRRQIFTCEWNWLPGFEEGIASPGGGVTGECELPRVDTGNWTLVFARTVHTLNYWDISLVPGITMPWDGQDICSEPGLQRVGELFTGTQFLNAMGLLWTCHTAQRKDGWWIPTLETLTTVPALWRHEGMCADFWLCGESKGAILCTLASWKAQSFWSSAVWATYVFKKSYLDFYKNKACFFSLGMNQK